MKKIITLITVLMVSAVSSIFALDYSEYNKSMVELCKATGIYNDNITSYDSLEDARNKNLKRVEIKFVVGNDNIKWSDGYGAVSCVDTIYTSDNKVSEATVYISPAYLTLSKEDFDKYARPVILHEIAHILLHDIDYTAWKKERHHGDAFISVELTLANRIKASYPDMAEALEEDAYLYYTQGENPKVSPRNFNYKTCTNKRLIKEGSSNTYYSMVWWTLYK